MNKRVIPEVLPTAIVLVGLPYAGKSFWARALGVPIVSPDEMRLEVAGQRFFGPLEPLIWWMAGIFVRVLAYTGSRTIIIDGCHTIEKRRMEWNERLGSCPIKVRYKVFDPDPELSQQRARDAADPDMLPIIRKMAAQWEPLTEKERELILTEEEELNLVNRGRI